MRFPSMDIAHETHVQTSHRVLLRERVSGTCAHASVFRRTVIDVE
ncbi:hypothetical protein Sme01_55520 [Sphaerisporangium melleum]|uniref:Uncharacterized protein n=1 Tax=Sphaerisporangium melleum TaxID=321316 RepID=A0A917VU65_9ACTN|nr:hypothetical protein GCM10007964_70160 [Sphaerisporangium melleum]GII73076.1 hypothetical protein Sme01_55520 [Sphaerisporangium melleum]